MKKLFTLFFALLCLVMGVSTAQAQTELIENLTVNTSIGWCSYTATKNCCVDPAAGAAYIATGLNDEGNLIVKKISVIPKGASVFIKCEDDGIDVYATTQTASSVDGNLIKNGSYATSAAMLVNHAYILAKIDHGSTVKPRYTYGLTKIDTEITADELTMIQAKCFVYFENSVEAKPQNIVFSIEEENTSVESVETGVPENTNVNYYNLAGQKIGSDYKGVVIGSNGKKYVK